MKHEYQIHWGTGRQRRVYCGIPYNTNFPISENWETVTCQQCLKRMNARRRLTPSIARH